MKNLITYILLAVLLTACIKNKNKEITVTGRLMQSCEIPAANKNGLIYLSGGGILANPSTSLEFTTDENGYFTVTHNESFSDFSVRTSANHSVLEASISGDEKELGEVYIFPPSINYYLNLDVSTEYTEFDTLYYRDLGYPQNEGSGWSKKIAGPFSNSVIDTVYAVNINGLPVNFNSSSASKMMLGYNINYNSIYQNTIQVEFPHCTEEHQVITLKIE